MKKLKLKRFGFVLLGLCLLAAGCGSDTAVTDETGAPVVDEPNVEVSYFRPLPFDAGGAYYYVAQEQGLFDAEGVTATIKTGRGGAGTATAALISGSVEIAQGSVDSYISAISQGAEIVAFWNFLKPGVFGIMLNTEKVPTVADLKGKTVGVIGASSSTLSVLKLMLVEAEIAIADVKVVYLGCCTAQYQALVDGTVDAIGTWDAQVTSIVATAAKENKDISNLKYVQSDKFLGDILITSKDYLKNSPENLAGFMKAMTNGMSVMDTDPQLALDIAAKNIPNMDPKDPAQRATMDLRSATTFRDGKWDYELLATALALYEKAGLITVDPAVIDIERLFPSVVTDMVANKS